MIDDRWEWTLADLLDVRGQPEALTLEFKSSALFKNFEHGLAVLSRDIAAFANAEGGTILVGMTEKRGKVRTAIDLDEGINVHDLPPHRLQQRLITCIQPHLAGIRCQVIPLSSERPERAMYVISVPRGNTAYQASDYIYYGRNGGVTAPLPDHVVRLLMLRGSAPQVALEIGQCEILPKDQLYEYRFDLIVANTGAVSIHDFVLEIIIHTADNSLQMWAPTMFVDNEEAIRDELISVESMLDIGEDLAEHERHELLHGAGIPFQSGERLRCSFQRIMQILYQVEDRQIFPQDRIVFPGGRWLITSVPYDVPLRHYQPMLTWTIYVENGPPCSGILDLAYAFHR